MIPANKWDLVEEKESSSVKDHVKYIRWQCESLVDVPIIFDAVLKKQRIKAIETVIEVYQISSKKNKTIGQKELKHPIIQGHPPPA